jgi:hypothetical protein
VLNRVIADVEAEERRFERTALDGSIENTRVDVWPIEQNEWESTRQLPGHAARTADREGIVLYTRD